MLLYAMGSILHSAFTTSKSTCLIPASETRFSLELSPLQGFPTEILHLHFKFNKPKVNLIFLPPNLVPLPCFFHLSEHHPKGHSWPFSSILFFIQSPNLTLSKYLRHLSFPNGVTVAPRSPPESSSCPMSPRQSPSSLLWPLYPAKLRLSPSYKNLPLPLECSQCGPDIPKSLPTMLLMSNTSSSFLFMSPDPHFQGSAHLNTPALQMSLLLQTFTTCFPPNTRHPALWFNSFMWSVLASPLKWDCE